MDIDINGVNTVNENPTENNPGQPMDGDTCSWRLLPFFICFLGTEYLFDDMMALVTRTGAGGDCPGGMCWGASVLGFLLYPAVISGMERKRERAAADTAYDTGNRRDAAGFAGALARIICIFVMWQHASYGILLIAECLCFILLGMGGSAVHYGLSLAVKERYLAKTVGVSYGVGICLQFLNHQLVQMIWQSPWCWRYLLRCLPCFC